MIAQKCFPHGFHLANELLLSLSKEIQVKCKVNFNIVLQNIMITDASEFVKLKSKNINTNSEIDPWGFMIRIHPTFALVHVARRD